MVTDPVHPWLKDPAVQRLLALLVLGLLGFILWTSAALAGASLQRILLLVALRCAALLLALLALVRPTLLLVERNREPCVLYVGVDASGSMNVADNKDDHARWDSLTHDLVACAPEFDRLRREAGIETVFVRFGDGTTEFLPGQPGLADLKRTDTGQMLRTLFERRGSRGRPVALFVLSDGADTGGPDPTFDQARAWQRAGCPVHTFAYGTPNPGERPRDVRIVSLTTDPLVPAGGDLKVRVRVDAPGFRNHRVRLRLLVEDKGLGRAVAGKVELVTLALEAGNTFELVAPAPSQEGEFRVTVEADDPGNEGQPLPGEVSATNNRQSTYITVAREGLRVLLIDKRRGWEPQGIHDALASERRISLRTVWVGGTQPAAPGAPDPFELDSHRPDVVILGDVSAAQVRGLRVDAVDRLAELVRDSDPPTGLIVLGGYAAFGNGDWPGTRLGDLFPCHGNAVKGQLEGKFRLEPTPEGLAETTYRGLLQLRDGGADSATAWANLRPLRGLTKLGPPDPRFEFVLARAVSSDGQEYPALVAGKAGRGRILAFAGSETYRWRNDPQGRDDHARLWKQLVAWVANQQEPEATVRVRPDARRLPVGREGHFGVQMVGKGGKPLEPAKTTIEVVDADGKVRERPTATPSGAGELRGPFAGLPQPGEYRLRVTATAKDPAGAGAGTVTGTAEARFEVYEDEVEALHLAADHDALRDLAAAGGGRFHAHPAEDLPRALRQLQGGVGDQDRYRLSPNWRTSDTSLFLMGYVALFALFLATEWALRRRWGLL